MDGFLNFLRNLGVARVAMMAAVAVGLLAMIGFMTMRLSTPQMSLLYNQLDPADAGQIVQRLEAQQIPFQVKGDGTAIMVAEDQVARMRVLLANEGLPTGGSIGYELFDKSNALGQTSFVQNVNSLRALEGELSRTVRAINRIQAARVHLVLPERELFQRQEREPSASIMIKVQGGELERASVRAIQQLVSAAVPGMKPERVAIVDEKGRLLSRPIDGDGNGTSLAEERNLAFEQRLRERVEQLVGNIVGLDKVRVQVAAEVDYSRVVQNSELFDPTAQVIRSTQTVSENSQNNERSQQQDVSVQNQLPEAAANQSGGAGTTSSSNRSEETVNYEISRTTKTETQEAGRVKRITVAVLVDGTYNTAEDGTKTYVPRPQEELDRMANLVRASVGYDEKRGDRVDIQNLAFVQTEAADDPAEAVLFMGMTKADIFRLAEIGVLGLVAILVVLLVLRPLVARGIGAVTADGGPRIPGLPGLPGASGLPQLAGPGGMPGSEEEALAIAGGAMPGGSEVDATINIAQIEGRVKASSIKKVGEIVDKHPEEALAIMRSWLYEAK